MGEIELRAGLQDCLCALILHLCISVHDVGKEFLVLVIHQIAHPHHGDHIPDLSRHAAQMQAYGNVIGPGLIEMSEILQVDALRGILHPGLVKRLEGLPVLEQIIVLGRDGRDARLHSLNQPVSVLDPLRAVRQHFQYLYLESRIQPIGGTHHPLPVEVPADDAVQFPVRIVSVSHASRQVF